MRLLTVGGDGRLEVRALSWEIPEGRSSFEVRGWLNPFILDQCICSVAGQLPEACAGKDGVT